MTKTVLDAALDQTFDYIAQRADVLSLTEGVPTTAFQATTLKINGGLAIATTPLSEGAGSQDFTIADGVFSGRRLIVAAQSPVSAEDTGTADHLCLVDQSGDVLLVVTELTEPVALTPGTVIGVRSFSQEIGDPA